MSLCAILNTKNKFQFQNELVKNNIKQENSLKRFKFQPIFQRKPDFLNIRPKCLNLL